GGADVRDPEGGSGARLLLEDYKASLKYLSDHPKLQGIAQQNSFKHT
ncbi:hypothetical protein, partial [Escherichia coli]